MDGKLFKLQIKDILVIGIGMLVLRVLLLASSLLPGASEKGVAAGLFRNYLQGLHARVQQGTLLREVGLLHLVHDLAAIVPVRVEPIHSATAVRLDVAEIAFKSPILLLQLQNSGAVCHISVAVRLILVDCLLRRALLRLVIVGDLRPVTYQAILLQLSSASR